MKFRAGVKDQSEMIAIVKRAGWSEDQQRRDAWRWRDPETKALHTLADAVALLKGNVRVTKKD